MSKRIVGNTTALPNPQPDWNQTDESRADYIKNKPKQTNKSLLFETKQDLDNWMEGATLDYNTNLTKEDLQFGDSIAIQAIGYPDYYWDGERLIESGSSVGR